MIATLLEYLSYPFVRRALLAGTLIALAASLLGVSLVLRRLSFIGDGLSHVAFGAMAVAGALSLADNLPLSLAATVLCALLLLRRGAGGARVRGDAALAMLSVGAMAIGYLLMNLFPSSSNLSGDVCTTLFGSVSILTLTGGETLTCVLLAAAVVLYRVLAHHRTFDVAFDEDFARASGTSTAFTDTLAAAIVAVVIVVSMRLVGALLVSALLVFPAVTAMRLCKSFRAVTIAAAVLGTLGALAGLLVAILAGTPVGSTIVAVHLLLFVLAAVLARCLAGR